MISLSELRAKKINRWKFQHLKKAIIEKLEGLNEAQLIEVQELIENFHQQENIEEPQTDYHLEEWDLMPDWQKKKN